MEELYRLIQMSVSASILIGVILILRAHGQTFFSTRLFKLLWLIVLVRLLVPVNIPMPVSVQTLVQQRHELSVEEQQIIKMEADGQLNHVENSKPEKPAHNIQWLLTLLWFNGMIVVLFCFIITGIRQLNYLQEAITVENNSHLSEWFDRHPLRRRIQILSHDRMPTPLTYGVIEPKIILPKCITTQNDETLQMILNHEYIHICQGDYLWKLLMMLAIAFHWFNPMVWLMWRYFNRDIEIACDRNVTEFMNREERITYAQTLINIAEIQSKASWCSSYFGERPIKERIRLLMKRRKQTKFGIVCSAMIFMFSMTVFAGSGKAAEKKPISSAQELSMSAEYQEYEDYGVFYDSILESMTYNSRRLGYLEDEYQPGVFHILNDASGRLAIKAIRDEQGKLTGFEELEDVEFINQISEAERMAASMRPYEKAYNICGVTCDETTGKLVYNGHFVNAVYDADGMGILVRGDMQENAVGLVIHRNSDGSINNVEMLQIEEISELLDNVMGVYWTGSVWTSREANVD